MICLCADSFYMEDDPSIFYFFLKDNIRFEECTSAHLNEFSPSEHTTVSSTQVRHRTFLAPPEDPQPPGPFQEGHAASPKGKR